MRCIHRILVAVKDPTALSLPAVAKATQLARALGADLELFHAIDEAVYVDMMGSSEARALQTQREERAACLQRLERIAARLRLHTKCVTVWADWDYPGYEAIIRRAQTTGADLIVAECHLGSHLAAGLRRLPDWELVRLSPVPVLLVRGPRPYHRPTILTAAVDPSHASGQWAQLDGDLLDMGTLLMKALRGKLHAVHACAHLVGGSPGEGVGELARRLHAGIVVAGSAARAGPRHLSAGNTSERLLNSLPCDLLVVKAAEFSESVPAGNHGPRMVTVLPWC